MIQIPHAYMSTQQVRQNGLALHGKNQYLLKLAPERSIDPWLCLILRLSQEELPEGWVSVQESKVCPSQISLKVA